MFIFEIWNIQRRVDRRFSHDVTAAILVFQNNETATMLVFQNNETAALLVFQNNETAAMLGLQTNPVRVELFRYVNGFFYFDKFA